MIWTPTQVIYLLKLENEEVVVEEAAVEAPAEAKTEDEVADEA